MHAVDSLRTVDQVTFNVDSNGILEVTAEANTGRLQSTAEGLGTLYAGHEDSPKGRDSDHQRERLGHFGQAALT